MRPPLLRAQVSVLLETLFGVVDETVVLRRTEATPEDGPHLKSVLRRGQARRRRARKLPLSSGQGSLAGGVHRFRRSTPVSGHRSNFLKHPSIIRLQLHAFFDSRLLRIRQQQAAIFCWTLLSAGRFGRVSGSDS